MNSDTTQARAIFEAKWPTLRAAVAIRARRRRLPADQQEELLQFCGLALWRECLKAGRPGVAAFQVRTEIILLLGLREFRTLRRGLPCIADLALPEDSREPEAVARPAAALLVDGARMTATDARLDDPARCQTWQRGITAKAAAARLGVTAQRIRQLGPRLGGVQFGREWRFPADLRPRQIGRG